MTHTMTIRGVGKRAKHFMPSGAVCGNGDLCLVTGDNKKTLTFHIGKVDTSVTVHVGNLIDYDLVWDAFFGHLRLGRVTEKFQLLPCNG